MNQELSLSEQTVYELLYQSPAKKWTVADIASRCRLNENQAAVVVQLLQYKGFIRETLSGSRGSKYFQVVVIG